MVTAIPARRSIVLIGLMGAGKTIVGSRLGKRLCLPFTDADDEVVTAAGCSIGDIFDIYGETAFREVENRVITRLLNTGQKVLATGGGAFMDPEIRAMIKKKGVSVWLRADINVLFRRTQRHDRRPLLNIGDARATLEKLMNERYPVYAEADIIVDSGDETPAATTKRAADAIADFVVHGPAKGKDMS